MDWIDTYLPYMFFYIWFMASCAITVTACEAASLRNWKKVMIFILWPIVFPFCMLFIIKDWLFK